MVWREVLGADGVAVNYSLPRQERVACWDSLQAIQTARAWIEHRVEEKEVEASSSRNSLHRLPLCVTVWTKEVSTRTASCGEFCVENVFQDFGQW